MNLKDKILDYLLKQFTPRELLEKLGFRVGVDKGICSSTIWVRLDMNKWHIAEWEIRENIEVFRSPLIDEKFNRLK